MTDCLLKYSNANFFGKIDMDNRVYLMNPDFCENTQFLSYARNLFTQLCLKASSGPLYAQGKQKMLNGQTFFGSVECTKDLSGTHCKSCLDVATNEFLSRVYEIRGGRAIFGSCYTRLKLYRYF